MLLSSAQSRFCKLNRSEAANSLLCWSSSSMCALAFDKATLAVSLGEQYDGPDDVLEAGRWGGERVLEDIRTTLESINIHYDEWFSQASIEESGAVAETVERAARPRGWSSSADGATVAAHHRLRRPQGPRARQVRRRRTPTWPDIAYHRDKFGSAASTVSSTSGAPTTTARSPRLQAGGRGARRRPATGSRCCSGSWSRWRQRSHVEAGRQRGRPRRPPRRGRSRRDPAALLLQSIDQPATFDLDVVAQRVDGEPRLLRAVRARPHRVDRPGRGRARRRAAAARRASTSRLLDHERELEVLRSLSELPDVVRRWRCDERAPHKVTTWVRELADRVPRLLPRLLRDGRRRQPPSSPRPGCGWSRRPRSGSPSASTCSACQRPGVDVSGRVSAIPRVACCPTRPTVGADGRLYDRRLSTSSTLAAEFGTPLFVYDEAHLRARCREAVAAFGRRRRLRDQGVPVPGDGPAGARGGHAPRRRDRRRAARRPGRRRARPTGSCCTATTRASTSCAGARTAGVGRIVVDSLRRARPPRRAARRGRPACPTVLAARHARASRPTPTSSCSTGQDDSKFGFGLASRRRRSGPSSGRGIAVGRARRPARPHRQPGLRRRVLRTRRSRCSRRSSRALGLARAVDRRRPRRGLRRGRGGADASPQWARSVRDGVRRQPGIAAPRHRRAGPGDRRRRRPSRSTRSARSRRSPASAPTSRSTAA